MSHEEFFDEYGRVVLQQTGEYDWFTVEDLFQAFKTRIMFDIASESKKAKCRGPNDKPEEL